jgi:hypothetical protein
MNTERLERLIESDKDSNQLQKNILKGFILRAKDNETERQEVKTLVEQVANEKKLSEVVVSTDEVIIYTVYGKDEWDIKYPFRSIYLKDGKWNRTSTVSPSLDTAFLVYLSYKYQGGNSQFADFALKMLDIKIE